MYAVRASNGMWIKFTCNFGPFYGSMVLTDDPALARKWTRQKDALRKAAVAEWRCSEVWTQEAKKWGALTFDAVAL